MNDCHWVVVRVCSIDCSYLGGIWVYDLRLIRGYGRLSCMSGGFCPPMSGLIRGVGIE